MTKRTPSTSLKLRLSSVELVDGTHQCDHAEETEQWLSEDFHRPKCEVRARRDAKVCCKILTALGRREWKTWNDVPLELRKDIERIHRNLGDASADQLEKLFRDANVSDDAISALKHFRCDACDRLTQPPSKREVAVNHAETFNDIVSVDVNFWKIIFKRSREKKTLKVLNIVDAASGMHIAIQIADQTAETIGRGIFVEPTLAEAHWQMGQVENNVRYLRQMGYRIVEDIDVSQSDFQKMLNELADAKNSLDQHNGYMPRQWVFGLIPRVPCHMLEENSDLPNLDPEGRFRRIAEMRHKCRMAAIETVANAKIRKSLIGRSRPMRGNYVPGDLVHYWRAGNGVHQAQGQWLGPGRVIGVEGVNVWVSHRATAIKCAKEQLQTWCTQTAGPDTTAATDTVSAAKTTIIVTVFVAITKTAMTEGSKTTAISSRTRTTGETRCTKTGNQHMSVKSRDQIKNHSKHHDRSNEFECKMIHQQLMMD